ncbi:MAG: 16S rRNA (cytosine(1402)-N(4))-methyltransferase RsmH [Deltaproteobacteria bacterium]|nr:16S rRNA (cytosine(1402)-N(4))-methyltransferase RsmH [Deltaproteobacteria bacterium]
MSAEHIPVMLDRVLVHLDPRPGRSAAGEPRVYLDATTGLGGHAEAILVQSAPDGRLFGLDRDPAALEAARARLVRFGDRCRLVHGDFAELPALLAAEGLTAVDGLLADLGLSSAQLADADRGFSLQLNGPLDMRMDPTRPGTAGDLLDTLGEERLAEALGRLGGERYGLRVARVLLRRRRDGRLRTTVDLREAVHAALGRGRAGRIDAATRTFQALRMLVNREEEALRELLAAFPRLLRPGGRAVLLSFHSGEDRLVKQAFRELARDTSPVPMRLLTKHPERPGRSELRANPRARSVKLRAVERREEAA